MQRSSTPLLLTPLLVGLTVFGTLPGCGDDDSNGNQNQGQIIPREDVAKACLASDACGVMPFLYASLCVEANWDQQYHTSTVPIWNAVYACVLQNAGDCGAVRACFGGGAEPPPAGQRPTGTATAARASSATPSIGACTVSPALWPTRPA